MDNRVTAIGLTVAGLATVAATVASAADSGYHFDGDGLVAPNHRSGHIYLNLLSPPSVGAALALALLIAAGYVGLRRRGLRIAGTVLAGVLAALVALDCYGEAVIGSMFDVSGGETVASSPRYDVVEYALPVLFRSDHVLLYVRARRSLLSYEADTPIACFMEESSAAGPEWFLERATLTGDSVHVTAQDGTSWDVRFDPATLRPENPVDRCTGAPDIEED